MTADHERRDQANHQSCYWTTWQTMSVVIKPIINRVTEQHGRPWASWSSQSTVVLLNNMAGHGRRDQANHQSCYWTTWQTMSVVIKPIISRVTEQHGRPWASWSSQSSVVLLNNMADHERRDQANRQSCYWTTWQTMSVVIKPIISRVTEQHGRPWASWSSQSSIVLLNNMADHERRDQANHQSCYWTTWHAMSVVIKPIISRVTEQHGRPWASWSSQSSVVLLNNMTDHERRDQANHQSCYCQWSPSQHHIFNVAA